MTNQQIPNMVLEMIKFHEGTGPMKDGKFLRYKDTNGYWTIGWGHLLRNENIHELSVEEAESILKSDIWEAMDYCEELFEDFHSYSPNRQAVLIDMMFNRGIGHMRESSKIVPAIKKQLWAEAAYWMLNSPWGKQVGSRAKRLALMLEQDISFEQAKRTI